jgi:hypothetical protein
VSDDRTQFYWLTAVGISGSGGDDPSNEPIGHEDRTGSLIAFDNATRTFSIQPANGSYVVWCVGLRYEKANLESIQIPNVTGLYYISFNAQGQLQYSTDYFVWDQDCPTAYVYWNSTTQRAEFFADERHGITMDWQTHEYLHRTRGAAYANGFDASNFDTSTQNGNTDAQAKLDIDNGTFFDEDLQVDVRHSLAPAQNTWEQQLQGPARIPVFYRSGTSYVYDAPTDFPVKQGTTHPVYNSSSGGNWSTTELGANSYGIQWIVATNQLNYPILSIMGQTQYNNVGQAEAASWADMDLDGLPIVEIRVLYKIVFRATGSNTPGCYFEQIDDYRNALSNATSTAAAVVDHGNLTGLADDDHPQYAFRNTSPTITLAGDATGSVTLTDLGNGTLTLAVVDDSHTHDSRYYTETEVNNLLSGKSDTSHNHTYDVNNAWLRDNGDNANVKLYGNSRQMVFRTDGTSEYASGVGAYPFTWMYGGDASSNRRMLLNTSGQLWLSNYGWLHDAFAPLAHSHSYISTSTTQGSNLYIRNSSPTIYLRDTDHQSGMIHQNSNLMYFLRGSGTDSTSWATVNGAWPLVLNMTNNNAEFGGNIYFRAVNGAHDVVYRTGGMYMTWDADSYGTNYEHSITSTDGSNSWGDHITINSYGNVRINIDSNNNGSNGFYVGRHSTGTNADLLGITDALVATTYAEWKFRYASTSNDWSAQPVQLISPYDIGLAIRSYDGDAHTVQVRPSSGLCYFQNHNDGAGVTLVAAGYSTSSMKYKQDIETWDTPKSVGAAVGPEEIVDATSIVKSLRPVTYRWDKMHHLSVSPKSERRKEALKRLNVYRRSQGLENFTSEELVHQCGRDCDGTPEEPCLYYRNWDRKHLGFIAEEAGSVSTHLGKEGKDGDNTLIDPMAMAATLVKAFQEIETRLSALEGS